jgi:membrane protease YdiL (CAAX protease family)
VFHGPTPDPASPEPSAVSHRIVALLEILICSDYPTQLALGTTFAALGYGPYARGGELRVSYVVGLSIADAILLLGLIFLFLHSHGERPRDVLLGRRPLAREAAIGMPLTLVALGIAVIVLLTIQRFAPSLHTVSRNPLQALLASPRDAWLFAFVVVVAGGVREEIQRAFLLHRFDVWLGGGTVGLIVTSIGFGAGHLLQGADAALATGLLGAFWGLVYLRRRSAVAPMVSHAGFDLIQIVQFLGIRGS